MIFSPLPKRRANVFGPFATAVSLLFSALRISVVAAECKLSHDFVLIIYFDRFTSDYYIFFKLLIFLENVE